MARTPYLKPFHTLPIEGRCPAPGQTRNLRRRVEEEERRDKRQKRRRKQKKGPGIVLDDRGEKGSQSVDQQACAITFLKNSDLNYWGDPAF